MNVRYTLGIDLGITSHHSAVLFDNQVGRPVVKRFTFPHTAAGLQKLHERVKQKVGAEGVRAVMEPTGKVWIPASGWLREHGVETLMTSPMLSAAYRKKRRKGGKSNQIDADTLARLPQAEGDRLNAACLREQKTGDLHDWCKFHVKLTANIAAIKNRIHSTIQPISPNLLKCFPDDPFTQLGRAYMGHYVNPEKLLKRGQKRVIETLAKRSRSEVREVTEVVQKLFACARSALELHRPIKQGHGMSYSFESIQQRVELLLKHLELLEEQVSSVETTIAGLHREVDPEASSRSLPGFGKHISAVVDSAVADIRRFPQADHFAAYVRCVPKQNSTGAGAAPGEHERQPLRKEGNRYLQKHFYLAADVARRYDAELAKVYLELKSKGRHHNQCVIAVARRLAMRYHALKQRQLRDPQATYQFRDLAGNPITKQQAKELADQLYEEAAERAAKEKPHTTAKQPADQSIPRTDETTSIREIMNVLAADLGVTGEELSAHLKQLKGNELQQLRESTPGKENLA